jgi:hypothetical protein
MVISPMRPDFKLPDVGFISAFHAEIMGGIHRSVNVFTVLNAVNKGFKHRVPDTIREI